jgi:hypothetical protein
MEGKRASTNARMLGRCYQCNRYEEELWALAYGEIWPVIRKSRSEKTSSNADQRGTSSVPKLKIGA